MSEMRQLIRDLRLLVMEEFDEDQPRDSDGRFAAVQGAKGKKSVGKVGDYKGLSPEHTKRISAARDKAENDAAARAKYDVQLKSGHELSFEVPDDVKQAMRDAEIKVRGSDLSTIKNDAERKEREAIDQEDDDARAIAAATKAGHVLPIFSDALGDFQAHAKTNAAALEKLGNELHSAQEEAAEAIKTLNKYDTDDDTEDSISSPMPGDPEDVLGLLSTVRSAVLGTTEDLHRIVSGDPKSDETEGNSETNLYGAESETEVPELPEYDADEEVSDPDEEFDDAAKKDPGTFEEFCKRNDHDSTDPDFDEELVRDEYDGVVKDHKEYSSRKKEYDEQEQRFQDYDKAFKARKKGQLAQAGVAQTALEKVYAKTAEVLKHLKSMQSEHEDLAEKARDEVQDTEDLVNTEAFAGKKQNKDKTEYEDPKTQAAYEDAKQAAEVLGGKEFNRRDELTIDFDGVLQDLKDSSKEMARNIKALAKLTKREPAIEKPKPKAKKAAKKAKPVEDDDLEDDEDE